MVLAETGWSRTGLLPMITKQQYRKLMSEYQQTGNVTVSAMKADVSRPTARKYLDAVQPPNELQAKHTWRTREDSLVEIWPQAVVMLEEAPDLEAKALFEYLWERSPWAVQEKHLRTFQRRVKLWRLQYGPDKEVFFPQDWEAGRAMQLDWTNANELAITIAGHPYEHLLCHSVLPHSNWEWATRCLSESLLSLRQGLQEALHRLGKVTSELRMDNSSAATHRAFSAGVPTEMRIHSGNWYPAIGRTMMPRFCSSLKTRWPSPTRTRMKLAAEGMNSSCRARTVSRIRSIVSGPDICFTM